MKYHSYIISIFLWKSLLLIMIPPITDYFQCLAEKFKLLWRQITPVASAIPATLDLLLLSDERFSHCTENVHTEHFRSASCWSRILFAVTKFPPPTSLARAGNSVNHSICSFIRIRWKFKLECCLPWSIEISLWH